MQKSFGRTSRTSSGRIRETGDTMPNTQYQDEMLELVTTRPFDAERAAIVVQGIPNVDETIVGDLGYRATLMSEAVKYNNLEAVRFLFERGADPNYVSENSLHYPFGDLQFGPYNEPPEENEIRYQIAKLFLEHGANPNLLVEGETIYDQVTYEIYNEPGLLNWDYSIRFYKLLVLYGGGGRVYGKPEFSEPIDLNRADEYQVCLYRCEDGYHIEGHLLNPDGEDIGIL